MCRPSNIDVKLGCYSYLLKILILTIAVCELRRGFALQCFHSISICSRDAFNFNIVNFPYMSSNIPANPTYGVYVSQLIRISRICDTFQSFFLRHRLLTERLIKQGFWYSKLCKCFKKFVSRHNALFSKYGVSVRTHVHEGICIQLVVKHELSKHNIITTSRGHST